MQAKEASTTLIVELIPVGTLGGGRELLKWLPEFDSAAPKFLDASAGFRLFSYAALCA